MGDGKNLQFSFEGEGEVTIALSETPSNFRILGADSIKELGNNEVGLQFHTFGLHTVSVTVVNSSPVVNGQSVMTQEDNPVAITLNGSDADGDSLTFKVISDPANGLLSGTPPNLTYIPFVDFYGADSFTFMANDGKSEQQRRQYQSHGKPHCQWNAHYLEFNQWHHCRWRHYRLVELPIVWG